MPLAVNEQSSDIKALQEDWNVLEPLMGGTPAMRKAGIAYLPQWPNEEAAAYNARLATATLMPAYRRTVGVMGGKPFSSPLTLEDAPQSIETWAEDIDQQGVNLHAFAAEMFNETLAFGLAGVLVDYPDTTVRGADGKPAKKQRTVAQVEAEGLRPYFVRVRHGQILGWRSQNVAGRMKLTQLRIKESREVEDGQWGTTMVDVVRVLVPGAWATYEKDQHGKWLETASGVTTLDYVPFVPFYGSREAFMVGRAPMLDLGYLNVKHWQSQSDQDTILHVARVPILAMIGAEDSGLTVGASTAVKLPLGADMKFVEHSGAAIAAGETSLAALQEQMIQTGAELLVKKPGDRSATESANDAEANKSDLQRLAETFEDSLDAALQIMADYAKLPKGGNVLLFKDFGAATLSDASATLVHALQQGGLISKATALTELQRRGVLSADIDVEDELEAAEADGPAMGELGLGDGPLPTPKKSQTIRKNADGSMTATED